MVGAEPPALTGSESAIVFNENINDDGSYGAQNNANSNANTGENNENNSKSAAAEQFSAVVATFVFTSLLTIFL